MGNDGDWKKGESDPRRKYYDHESAYQKILETGGKGWDDLPQPADSIEDERFGSYDQLQKFLGAKIVEPTTALEIGCGGGQASLLLAEYGFDVTGVDYAETAVTLARQNASDRGLSARFDRADVTNLENFEDETFGLVIDNHCLHCIVAPSDRAATFASVFRVLRPGGLFFCDTMSREGDYRPELMDVDPQTHTSRAYTRIWVSETELRNELEAAGFEIELLERTPQEPGTGDVLTVHARRHTIE